MSATNDWELVNDGTKEKGKSKGEKDEETGSTDEKSEQGKDKTISDSADNADVFEDTATEDTVGDAKDDEYIDDDFPIEPADHSESDEFVIPNISSSRFHKMPYVESQIWVPPGEKKPFTPPVTRKGSAQVTDTEKKDAVEQQPAQVKKYQTSQSEYEDDEDSSEAEQEEEEEQSFLFCVRGLEESSDIEKLRFYLESCSKCDLDEECLIWVAEDHTMAIISFSECPDMDQMKKKMKKKPFDKHNPLKLELCPVKKLHCVVASLHDNRSILMDDIKEYFQNQSSSGGGKVEELRKLRRAFYRIQFRKDTAAKRVCDPSRQHKIRDVVLSVSLLYRCEFGELWDYTKHDLPPPEEVAEPALEKEDSSLSQMGLGEGDEEQEEDLVTETANYEPKFLSLLLRDGIIQKTDQLFEDLSITVNADEFEIIFKGKRDDVNSAKTIIGVQADEIVSWKIDSWDTNISREQFRLLLTPKVQDLLKRKCLEASLLVDVDFYEKGIVVYAKSSHHKTKAQNLVYNIVKYSEIPLQFKPKEYLESNEWKQLCAKLESQHEGVLVIGIKSDDIVTVTSVASIHEEILEILGNQISHEKEKIPIPEEEARLFIKKHCIYDLQRRFLVKIKLVRDGIEIYGSSQGISNAKSELADVLLQVCVEPHRIERLGIENVIGPKKEKIFHEVEKRNRCVICWKGVEIKKGVTSRKGEETSPKKKPTEKQSHGASNIVPDDHESTLKKVKEHVICQNGTTIRLVKGELASAQADSYVCTLNPDLDFSKSEAGRTLLAKSKKKIQDRTKQRYPRTMKYGDVATVSTTDLLPCKSLHLGSLPDWAKGSKDKDSNNTLFKKFMKTCIVKADELKHKSIAFTALGTGIHGFPVENVAKLMYEAVVEYDREHEGSRTAKDVQFLLFHKDIAAITAFEDEEYNQIQPSNRLKPYKVLKGPLVMPNGINVSIVVDGMEKQKADVLVCSTETTLNLRNGDVAKALLQTGGHEIQENIRAHYRNGIQFGQVAKVTGGRLSCKNLYITTMPNWSDSEERLKKDEDKYLFKAIMKCLDMANKDGRKSIAFPALGTGQTAYPKGIVAKIMYSSVYKFATQNPGCTITDVRFVVVAKDEEAVKVFKHEEQIQLSPPETYSSRSGEEIYYTTTSKNKIQVSLETGDLPKYKADVIVSTVASNLDLAKGLASRALLEAEGRSLQEECKTKYPQGITQGSIAIVNVSKLQCKFVYLGTLPRYNEGGKEIELKLYDFVKKCLDTASRNGITSIAFPALCTGYNGYPYHRVAALSYEAVKSFAESQEETSVKSVHFVTLPNDIKSLRAFQREEKKRVAQNVLFKWMVPVDPDDQAYAGRRKEFEEPADFSEKPGTSEVKEVLSDSSYLTVLIISDDKDNIRQAKLEVDELVDNEYRIVQEKPWEPEGDTESDDHETDVKIQLPQDLPLNETKSWVDNFSDERYKTFALKLVVPRISKELNELYPELNATIIPCLKAGLTVPLPVFIAYSEEVMSNNFSTETIVGFNVLIRNPKVVDKEGIRAHNYENEHGLKPTQDKLNLANEVLEACSKDLWDTHSNLNSITVSGVKSRRKGFEEKLCIVLSCSSKGYIPAGEKPFPKSLKANNITIDVDVREGFFEFGPGIYDTTHSRNYHKSLKMGCSISGEAGPFFGTMGPFVDLGNDKIGFLTCAHVLFEIENKELDYTPNAGNHCRVLQPAVTSSGNHNRDPCGHVVRAVFRPNLDVSIDAAVVEITDSIRKPSEGLFALEDIAKHEKVGFQDMPKFNNGTHCHYNQQAQSRITNRTIVKFGSETHLTRGMLAPNGIEVRSLDASLGLPDKPDHKMVMKKQLAVEFIRSNFFIPGDSGSGVFVMEDCRTLHCIGIAIGNTSDGYTVVTPIKNVLETLQLKHGLKKFPEDMET